MRGSSGARTPARTTASRASQTTDLGPAVGSVRVAWVELDGAREQLVRLLEAVGARGALFDHRHHEVAEGGVAPRVVGVRRDVGLGDGAGDLEAPEVEEHRAELPCDGTGPDPHVPRESTAEGRLLTVAPSALQLLRIHAGDARDP